MRVAAARWLPLPRATLCALALLGVSCDDGGAKPAPAPSARPAGVLTSPPGASSIDPSPPGRGDARPAGAPHSSAPDDSDEGQSPAVGDGDERDPDLPLDCPPPEAVLDPVQLLRLQFTSAVASKKAADELQIARPGQRVWAHLTVRNRTGRSRCLRLIFRVNGKERTSVVLEVGHSWSWRTWAYNTLRPADRSGRLELEVTDERGRQLALEGLPIVPATAD